MRKWKEEGVCCRRLPQGAPDLVDRRWNKEIRAPDGSVGHRILELFVIVELKNRIAANEIWIKGLRTYWALDEGMISHQTYAIIKAEARDQSSPPRALSQPSWAATTEDLPRFGKAKESRSERRRISASASLVDGGRMRPYPTRFSGFAIRPARVLRYAPQWRSASMPQRRCPRPPCTL